MVKLILNSGKGGLGKTTLSCAMGVEYARQGYKTLIVSTDPAHSTSDSLGVFLEDKPTMVTGNLWGVEINPAEAVKRLYPSFTDFIQGPLESVGMDDLANDIAEEDMMIPGLDEALAFDILLEFVEGTEFDLVIFDTAPTGHTLRFLSIPELLDTWLAKLLRFKAKLNKIKKTFGGKGVSSEDLKRLQKRVTHIRRVLCDPNLTAFQLVVIPELMAIEETKRAKKILAEYNIALTGLLINNIIPDGHFCVFCEPRRKIQKKYLMQIKSMGLPMAYMDQKPEEVHGLNILARIGKAIVDQLDWIEPVQAVQVIGQDNGDLSIGIYYPGVTLSDVRLRGVADKLIVDVNGTITTVDCEFIVDNAKVKAKLKNHYLCIEVGR